MKGSKKSAYQRSLNHYTILFMIILLLLMIIALIVKFSFDDYKVKDLMDQFFESLIGAIIPLLLFNMIFEYLIKRHQSEAVSDAIVETLLLKEETLKKFSENDRKIFIQNCTQSLIGKEEGEMLYSTLFSPYLSEKQSFRRNFKYYIFYTPYEKLENPPLIDAFHKDDYHWVIEELSYEKSYVSLGEEMLVGFSFNEQKLENYFKDSRVIFRENLDIGQDGVAYIRSLTNEELLDFIQKVLQFSLEINGNIALITGVEHDGNGFVIRLKHNQESIRPEECKYCRLKFNFRMPQHSSKKKFIVIVSEPTHSVDILFSNQIDRCTVTAIPFFDQEEIVEFLPNNIIAVELPGWVLPTSGIVFVWEEK